MASLQLVLLILATVFIHIQAQNNQSACNQATNQSTSVDSISLVKELESEAENELRFVASTVMSMIKSEQERMAKVKTAMAGVKADLTSEMTIKAIVTELKAELTKDQSMAVTQLKEMMNTQKDITRNLVSDVKALRKGLSNRLDNSDRKIEWAITDGSLAPRNTSWVMESIKQLGQRLDDIEQLLNQSRQDLDPVIRYYDSVHYADCAEIHHMGNRTNGVYTIYPEGRIGVKAYCDMETEGGGWTVFQKRYNGEVDFFRGWDEYVEGFGEPDKEYWLGLLHIHDMSQVQPNELYVGVTDFDVGIRYAKYGRFKVSSEGSKFRLTIGSYSGNAGDSLKRQNGQKFSTRDEDNDSWGRDCSNTFHGAWWYKDCLSSNLNGRFSATKISDWTYMSWRHLRGNSQSMKASVMMMRPVNFKP